MKKFLLLFVLALAGATFASAQSAKACCAGKDKAACATKEASAKAHNCAGKSGDKACCSTASAATGAAAIGVANTTANIVEETFTVYGNCGMCKRTIENALSGVDAILSSNWDVKTKQLTVKYDSKALELDDIKAKIAAVGYDSDTHRAPDEVYNNLHGCCQYERPKG
jgi:copper chaperone CopZ